MGLDFWLQFAPVAVCVLVAFASRHKPTKVIAAVVGLLLLAYFRYFVIPGMIPRDD